MAKPKLKHIHLATVPWRPERQLTECLLPIANLVMITRAESAELYEQWIELFRQWHKAGSNAVTRPVFATDVGICKNCLDRVNSWKTWDQDPAECMRRFLEQVQVCGPSDPEWVRVVSELQVIDQMIQGDAAAFRVLVNRLRAMATMAGGTRWVR